MMLPSSPPGGEKLSAWPSAWNDENSNAARSAPTGVQRPTIIAARAMKPRPVVMPAWNELPDSIDRNAPASPAKSPARITLR